MAVGVFPLDSENPICELTKMQEAREAARLLLAQGKVTLSEARQLAGVSQQLMAYWARDLRCREIRAKRLAVLWKEALNGEARKRPSKAYLRKATAYLTADYVKRGGRVGQCPPRKSRRL